MQDMALQKSLSTYLRYDMVILKGNKVIVRGCDREKGSRVM